MIYYEYCQLLITGNGFSQSFSKASVLRHLLKTYRTRFKSSSPRHRGGIKPSQHQYGRKASRHAPPSLSCPPLISAAWVCNPRRSLGAQVSSVCPQISFVIPGTTPPTQWPSPSRRAVFMFVKLFSGMARSNV